MVSCWVFIVAPSLESTSSTSCCFKVCVHNASRLPLQDVSLHFESSSTNSEHPLFQISDSEPLKCEIITEI